MNILLVKKIMFKNNLAPNKSYIPFYSTGMDMYPRKNSEGFGNNVSPYLQNLNTDSKIQINNYYSSILSEPNYSSKLPENTIIDPKYTLTGTEPLKDLRDGVKNDVDTYITHENTIFTLGLVTSATFLILAIVITKN